MTAAQKTAKAKFKQAIAYRQKTGVSLKEAFAHIYGKKVGAVKKKVIVKKVSSSNNIKIISGIGNLEKATYSILGVKIGFKKIVDKETNLTYLMIVDLVKNKNIIPVRYNSDTDSITYDLANYIDVYSTNKNKDTLIYKIRPDLKKLVIKLKDAVQKLNKSNKKPVAKKVSVKKPIAKKVTRKVVKKKAAPKKKVAKKKLTRKDYDKRFQADKPGKRTSASGNTYYEYRENRSDRGKLLGIKIGNMPTYNDKDAAREIQIFGDNDFMLYQQRRKPILINLEKKYKKGTYDINKAAKLWRNYVDAALKKYHIVFGTKGDKWYDMLSIADRNLLSLDYAIETKKQFDDGEFIN